MASMMRSIVSKSASLDIRPETAAGPSSRAPRSPDWSASMRLPAVLASAPRRVAEKAVTSACPVTKTLPSLVTSAPDLLRL